jgi:hypothetical protein
MEIRQRRYSLAVCLAALAMLLIAGCNQHTDKISDIVSDPAHYAGKEVTIAGEVTQRYELPLGLTNVAAYRVSDGTSQIWVLSRAGAPVVGDRVGLKGIVHEEGTIAKIALGSVIEEKGRKIQ